LRAIVKIALTLQNSGKVGTPRDDLRDQACISRPVKKSYGGFGGRVIVIFGKLDHGLKMPFSMMQ